ncbi:MAG TPA: aromatic ring-hydroxylating dioxygenase subunit alpha [Candidatus Acidoferrum sp.]|nr:aromatic ring-hydroxylating dioxygenase subunit alpha [Candidatus Acidoferrum sp.]
MQMTLPARYYTDESVFREEMERFYFGMWVCAGRVESIARAGEYFLADVAGESVIVTRDAGGSLRAFYNVCRHRGTRMCVETRGEFGGRIQCPYHGWTYGLDGKLLGAPHMDGAFKKEEYPLHEAKVDVWDGHIFLNLSREPNSFREQLADLPGKFAPWGMEDLRVYKKESYEVKANWKLIVLNYNECLHCPLLHPMLSRVTDTTSGENDTPTDSYIGGSMAFRGAAQTMSTDGVRRRGYLPGLNESQRAEVLYYAIYPNLFLSLHPDYVMVHRLWPRAADRTEVVTEWLFHPEEMAKQDFCGDDAVEFWDKTNKEDWAISELSQKGISSRAYTPGPYSARESLPSAFDRMIVGNEERE